jgi:capsular exopolysaccharide synthesis family protein
MFVDTAIQTHHPVPGVGRQNDEGVELVYYWRSISKHKWSVLGLASAITVLAAVTAFMMTPIYRSTVTLMIEQNKAKVVSIEDVYSAVGSGREYIQTQAEILKSRALASKVVDKLKLTTNPEFDPRQQEVPFSRQILDQLGIGTEKPQWTEEGLRKAVIGAFLSRMTVEPVRLSQLVKVSFESPDRETAAKIANAIADTFIENDMEARYQMTKRATDWLNERLSGLKKNLDRSERALQEYRDRAHIIDTKGLAQSGASRQVEELMGSLIVSRQRRAEAENAYKQVKDAKGHLDTLPMVMRNGSVIQLKAVENDLEKKTAELSKRYGPQHVRMIQAQAELKQARENTRRQINTVVSSMIKEYEVARANEQGIERALAEAKNYVQGINRKEFQLGMLERDVATNRQIYDMFMNRFKETSAASDMRDNVIARVVDPAVPAGAPIKPRKQQIILIAFVMALFFGVVVALLLERLDNTIKSADDIEEKLGQPMLTMLPLLSGKAAKSVGRHYLDEPKSVFSEGIRTARTGVLLSAIDTQNKLLLVTSAVPYEGKTTFAINLALAHAQTKKVLLIDADMRRPSLVKQLGLDKAKPGLSSVVSGASSLSECVQTVGGSSLHVITSGPVPPNPLELILSHRFKEVLKHCAAAYEIIVMDSPPVQLVSDAVVLSTMSTGVLFVVKADSTPYQMVRRGLRALQGADATLFGVVLNQLDFKKADRYYGAYTGYTKYDDAGYYTKPT